MGRAIVNVTLASVLFVAVAAVTMGIWLGLGSALETGLTTLLITPFVWSLLVARRSKRIFGWGAVAGAIIGFLVFFVPLTPMIWGRLVHGPVSGEGGIAVIAAVMFFGGMAIVSAPIGALVGLATVALQRRIGGQRG